MMYNEHFFDLVAFVVFIALVIKPAKAAIIAVVKKYTDGVVSSLQEADRLRKEAEKELEKVKMKSAAINSEIDAIVAEAEASNKAILAAARARAEQELEKRTKIAMHKIAQHEMHVQNAVINDVVAHVLKTVELELANRTDKKAKLDLIEGSINKAKKIIH